MTQATLTNAPVREATSGPKNEIYDPKWNGERLVPRRIVIETIFGCNAACGMCVINHPTDRPKGIMPLDKFQDLVDRLAPYRDSVEMFDLFGLGEPLIDPHIVERIAYVKAAGFRNLSFSTNAHLLSAERARALLDVGLDTVIFSIDGFSRETHEAVRIRTDYDRVVANCIEMIRQRDAGNFKTRFVVRFVRQDLNAHEWDDYRRFWLGAISPDRRDLLIRYDVHNWSDQVAGTVTNQEWRDPLIDVAPCHHIYDKLVILANGAVALCFEDILKAQFRFGNVFDDDPIDIFNSARFNKIRTLHGCGKRRNLGICSGCMVLYNEPKRVVIDTADAGDAGA